MSLTKKIYLTVSGYDIKLSDNLTFYQKDQLKLIFYINEYGIDYENNATTRALIPINPLNAILFIENPDGVDSVSSAKIEDNAVTFYLDSTHTQYVGVSRMQLRLFDQDGCAITLPYFTFEIRENIYGSGDVRFQNVVMVDQTGTVILTEDNDLLDVGDILTMGTEVAYPQVTKTIKELPIKHGLDGTEKLIVEDNEATKQAPLGTIVDEIKQNSQEKIREIESELAQTNAQLSDIVINVKNFGAVGDAKVYDWGTGNFYTDESKEVMAHNDTEAINRAIERCKECGGVLFFPKGNYRFDDTLLIDGFVVEGNGAILESTNPIGVSVVTGDDRRYVIDKLTITGRSVNGSVGISFDMKTHNSTARELNKVSVFNFNTDVKFNDNSYLIHFYNSKFANCKTAIQFPHALTNSGENISFTNCVFTAKEIVVLHEGHGELKFMNCSFDYFENICFKLKNRSLVKLYGCHIETNPTMTNAIIQCEGDGSTFSMYGGYLLLLRKDGTGEVNLPHVVYCNEVKNSAGCYFFGTTMDDIHISTDYFAVGNGIVKLEDVNHYQYSTTFAMLNKNFNLSSHPSMANMTIDGNFQPYDLIFIDKCTRDKPLTNPWNGGSIMIDNGGDAGLKIQKYDVQEAQATVVLAYPITRGKRHNAIMTIINQSHNTGYLNLNFYYAKLLENGNTPTITKKENISHRYGLYFTENEEKTLKLNENSMYQPNAPIWATHVCVELDEYNLAEGIMFVKNVIVNEF